MLLRPRYVTIVSYEYIHVADILGQIAERIELHEGEVLIDNYPGEDLNLEHITHIIANTYNFRDYHNAVDRYIQVVKPAWIETSLASAKLAHPRRYSPDPNLILSDVVAICADLPEGDKDAIAGGILAMGGNVSARLTTQVTHVVALSMDNEKAEQVALHNLNIHIVLPHWFDDCLKLGKKIDEGPYLLPDPEILKTPSERAPLGRPNKHVVGATMSDPQDPDSINSSVRKELTVFKNRKILLDKDLQIGPVLRNALTEMIVASGGKVVDKISTANILVCKYRDGLNYRTAAANKMELGNLSWLYFLIVHNMWTSPFMRLMHYPVPRLPLPGFEKLKISLSNYSGEARTYLENLILATGAECTKTLKQENTHLITAHSKSEKVAAAKDWNIVVVNHLWIEESYAKWEMQSINNPRYNQFPRKTNLGEVVGQTHIDRDVIRRHFLPEESQQDLTAKTTRKGKATSKPLDPSSNAKANARAPQDDSSPEQKQEIETPAKSRLLNTGKENVTPTTTGSRKSKSAALNKLHSMTPDIALFEKERKRVGGVVYGGRRKADEDRTEPTRKRSAQPEAPDDPSDEQPVKRQRTESVSLQMHLLISGYKAWVGKGKKEDEDISRLQSLGITVLKEPSTKVTHMAVPHIVRTAKFLTALAQAPTILSTDYIEACLAEETLLDPGNYLLEDAEYEKKHNVSLRKALQNAKVNEGRLLANMRIYCSEKINGGFDTMQAIAEANGTSLTTYRGRHMTVPSRRAGSHEEAGDGGAVDDEIYLLSSGTDVEKRLYPKFISAIEASRHKARVLSSEWLLTTALRQEMQPIEDFEIDVGDG